MDDRPLLYLEDLQVGQRFVTATHALSAGQIVTFAAQWDPQPFHLDDAAARESLFGGLAASGWHLAAISMRLQVDSGPRIAGGLIGAGCEITWPQPTRPTDTVQVFSEISALVPSRSRPDRGMATLRSETRNQADQVLMLLTSTLVVPRRARP